jgi:hypothetical protein
MGAWNDFKRRKGEKLFTKSSHFMEIKEKYLVKINRKQFIPAKNYGKKNLIGVQDHQCKLAILNTNPSN